jgi:hypothetical protein
METPENDPFESLIYSAFRINQYEEALMTKYGKPIWKFVLDAAYEIDKEKFTPRDIIQKIHETNPEVPANSIRTYVLAMAPNHPSSHHYPSTHKKHRYFHYLGNGQFRLLREKEAATSGKDRERTTLPKNEKEVFLSEYRDSVLSWTEENSSSLIAGRKEYSWDNKTLIECIDERNKVSSLIVSSRIRNNGGVDVETLDKVMSWGGFPPFPVRDNHKVLQITGKAFSFLDEGNVSEAILELMSVKRVGIASASKIIGLFDQNRLAIYDSRVGTALKTLKYKGEKIIRCPAGRTRPGDACSPKKWAENYEKLIWVLEIIRNKLNEKGYPFSIADVEMALFMMGK